MSVAQIIVRRVQPVFTGRRKNVQIHGILDGPRFMRHVRGYAQDFSGAHYNFFSVDRELQGAFENVGHLLIVVMVLRHVRAFLQQHAGQHHFFADHHLAVDQRIQLLAGNLVPLDVLQFRRYAHGFAPYSFAALSCRYMRANSSAFSSLKAPSDTNSASAAATAVRADRAASQNVSSAPTASLNGNASEPNMILSG